MALRIRSKWQTKVPQTVSLEDNAGALAYVIWQLALGSAKNLHAEDFHYDNDEQRVAVIAEYLCFLVHVADRMVYSSLDDDQRQRFVITLVTETTRHIQRNKEDIMGRGDYRSAHIELFNQRSAGYAETSFDEQQRQPGFDMLRYIGQKVLEIMGSSQTNRWVIDQVMEIDAPEAVDQVRKALDNLFTTSPSL